MLFSYEFYWIGANYSGGEWTWYSGVDYSWENPREDTGSPPSDKRAFVAEISNDHRWKFEKHSDSDTKWNGLCEKSIGMI